MPWGDSPDLRGENLSQLEEHEAIAKLRGWRVAEELLQQWLMGHDCDPFCK